MDAKNFIKKNILPVEANLYAKNIHYNLLLNIAISRTAAGAATRSIDPVRPGTWEFSGFSQNGEDGIIDYLISRLINRNNYFIEIGSGNGLENNTAYLAHIKKYAGLQIEGDKELCDDALLVKPWLTEQLNEFIDESSVERIMGKALYTNPDVYSIDIDGNDYYITKLLMESGLRPKIIVAEYNSAFGEERSISIPYDAGFNMFKTEHAYLYYGVSIVGWKIFLSRLDYEFISVESNGINAFFIDKKEFDYAFINAIEKNSYNENMHQCRLFKKDNKQQFEMIQHLPFYEIK